MVAIWVIEISKRLEALLSFFEKCNVLFCEVERAKTKGYWLKENYQQIDHLSCV
jgi:hypothetical protein